jgi:hypothetical protein
MLKTIKEAFGTTYPGGSQPEPIPHVPRHHPVLDVLYDVQSAEAIVREGHEYLAGTRLTKNDRDLLADAVRWTGWHAEGTRGMVNSMILMVRAADLISSRLKGKDRASMPSGLRNALERFESKLPPVADTRREGN